MLAIKEGITKIETIIVEKLFIKKVNGVTIMAI